MSFSVVRGSRKTLVEQVVDGLRLSIATGVYGPGDMLPTTRELADALGVSRIVTRSAMRELAEAGLVNPRPGVGCIVLGQKGKLWRGTVLFVAPVDIGDYYTHAFSDELSAIFVRYGWCFLRVSATRSDTSLLDLELAHPVDLAIVMFGNDAATKSLSKAGVPFVTIGSGDAKATKGCVANVRFVREASADKVVALAGAAGVTRAWQVGFEPQPDLKQAFASAKIALREILIRPAKEALQPEATTSAAQVHFERLFAKGPTALPDLLYFSDDYVCQGALLALLQHGVEAPRDVKVVTWSNRGNGPYYIRPLARVELAPRTQARALAERLLPYLSERRPIGELAFGTRFVPGETI